MKTNKTYASTNNVQLSSTTPIMTSPINIAEELENIMLKMIYRISQEEPHVLANVGNVA